MNVDACASCTCHARGKCKALRGLWISMLTNVIQQLPSCVESRRVTHRSTWGDATHGAASAKWGCTELICLPAHAATLNCTACMTSAMIITLGVSLGSTSGTTTRLSHAGGGPAAWWVTFRAWHLRLLRLTRTARVADLPSMDLFSVLWAIVAAACHCHCTEKGST
jgi:hypothetical protein